MAAVILLDFLWLTVLEAIPFDAQSCGGTIEIQNIITDHVLPTEFETGELPPSQSLPKLLFVRSLRAISFELTTEAWGLERNNQVTQ